MRRKTPKRQPKLSTDSLLKTSKKKKDIELTEQELDKVSAGSFGKVSVERGGECPNRTLIQI